MSFPVRLLPVFAVLALPFTAPLGACAQEIKIDRYYELETKYLFGFTDGTDIGAEGEKEIEAETTGAFQKRGGRYSSVEQEFEFEHVPSQYWGYEFSTHALSQQMSGVQGLSNISQTDVSGLSWKPKWLITGRGPGAPSACRCRSSQNGIGSTEPAARIPPISAWRPGSRLIPS